MAEKANEANAQPGYGATQPPPIAYQPQPGVQPGYQQQPPPGYQQQPGGYPQPGYQQPPPGAVAYQQPGIIVQQPGMANPGIKFVRFVLNISAPKKLFT